jgi:hypothetical protein
VTPERGMSLGMEEGLTPFRQDPQEHSVVKGARIASIRMVPGAVLTRGHG